MRIGVVTRVTHGAGAEITADSLRQQFGRLANVVLRDWTVCLAQYIPAGLTLTTVTVEDRKSVV